MIQTITECTRRVALSERNISFLANKACWFARSNIRNSPSDLPQEVRIAVKGIAISFFAFCILQFYVLNAETARAFDAGWQSRKGGSVLAFKPNKQNNQAYCNLPAS
jgi:hypothetical protein